MLQLFHTGFQVIRNSFEERNLNSRKRLRSCWRIWGSLVSEKRCREKNNGGDP